MPPRSRSRPPGVNRNIDESFVTLDPSVSEPAAVSSSNSAASLNHGHGIDAGLAEIFEEFRVAAEEEPGTNRGL